MTPDEYCQDRAAKSGSSFYYSFLFLPPERRRAITALYAFCREVDDVVDESSDPGLASTKLAWWRQELARLFAGTPQHPVTLALAPAIAPYGLTAEHLGAVIDGMEMDLQQTRYLDFEALRLYCWRVAGVVGLMSAGIFGYRDPATAGYAENLGIALQLTNIVRDVGEDARRGRVYLPQSDLAEHGVKTGDLLAARRSPEFSRLMAFEARRAHEYYDRAFALLPAVDRRAQRPGLIMAAIYRTVLTEIEHDGFPVLEQRISLTPLRKLWIAWRTWMTS